MVGNPQYISEIIKEFIVQGKECFPNLFTYQSDWLAHIDEFGLNPSYTVSYTGQSIYAPNTLEKPVKSAILKGSTKYRDIDTGEFLETFEEGRNLELVSVKMPVLTTTGKNLFDKNKVTKGYYLTEQSGKEVTLPLQTTFYQNEFIKVRNNMTYTISETKEAVRIHFYDKNKKYIKRSTNAIVNTPTVFNSQDFGYIRLSCGIADLDNIQLEESPTPTSYEPYKTNILTVNEDVTLRSNGSVYDELDLLTGKLTQRIDEDGSVLTQEVVKTVDLTILDQNGQNVKQLMAFSGGTHFITGSSVGSPLPTVSVSVETDLEETLKVCSLEGNTM